jgi:UPF0271 protein
MSVGRIDLNADLGEGAGSDAELLTVVTSASIACGAHAGNEQVARAALKLARQFDVCVGAHPGFRDRAHFGRVRLDLPVHDLQKEIRGQLEWLDRLAANENVQLHYVKLHGAMANMAAENRDYALAAFEPVAEFNPNLAVLAIDKSLQVDAARSLGLKVFREAYADRAYAGEGGLVPRFERGAILTDSDRVVAQCLRLAQRGEVVAADGTVIATQAQSICLHGDTPGAVNLARTVRRALEAAGIEVRAAI